MAAKHPSAGHSLLPPAEWGREQEKQENIVGQDGENSVNEERKQTNITT